jgi:hypothetical protein
MPEERRGRFCGAVGWLLVFILLLYRSLLLIYALVNNVVWCSPFNVLDSSALILSVVVVWCRVIKFVKLPWQSIVDVWVLI